MSAKDFFHASVRAALEKDGWTITHDPLHIKVDEVEFFIDLAAERILAAEKDGQKIAVEVKSFIGTSAIHEFHTALGQVLNYKLALRKKDPDRTLYLAVSKDIYQELFLGQFVQDAVSEYGIKLLIVNITRQEIALWKE